MPKQTANAKGEVTLGGRPLRADFNALCAFEEQTGTSVTAVDFAGSFSLRTLRALVCALGSYESAEAAGDAIEAAGMAEAAEAVGAALSAAFGAPDAEAEPGEA